MCRIPKETQFFLDGHKPSYYPQGELNEELMGILDKYPKIPQEVRGYHYFQNEHQMLSFILNSDSCTSGIEEMYVLGLSLGYPPKACEFFVKTRANRIPPQVFINFCGLHFGTHIDLIEENLNWLIDTYKVKNNNITLQINISVTGELEVLRYKGKLNVDKIMTEIGERIHNYIN